MEIINKKINEIKPYEKNPRKNDEAIKYVAESIKKFGFKVPIVIDKNGVIVAGHTRYKASKKLGLEEVPCIVADDLNEEQIKAFRLADNKVAEKSEWNFDLLDEELGDILNLDMSDFGFELKLDEEEKVKDITADVKKEEKRIFNTLKSLTPEQINANKDFIHQLAFQSVTLKNLSDDIAKNGVKEKYKNGANQWGYKDRTEVKAYNNMFKNYQSAMKQLNELLQNSNGTLYNDGFDSFGDDV